MRWEGREGSSNIEDRRGMGMPGGRGAGFGCIGLVIVIAISLVTGADPRQLLSILGLVQQMAPPPAAQEAPAGQAKADDPQAQFIGVVLKDTENTWNAIFEKSGKRYTEPRLVLFEGKVASACGLASAAVGPFYCPLDSKVYLDLAFFRRARPALRRARRLRAGLRRGARGGAPRPEPARDLGPGPGRAAARPLAGGGERATRCGSSCRPTAWPASGRPRQRASCSIPATSRRGCAPRPRSATT